MVYNFKVAILASNFMYYWPGINTTVTSLSSSSKFNIRAWFGAWFGAAFKFVIVTITGLSPSPYRRPGCSGHHCSV